MLNTILKNQVASKIIKNPKAEATFFKNSNGHMDIILLAQLKS